MNGTAKGYMYKRAFPLSNHVNKHSLFDCDTDHLSAYKVLRDRPFRGRVLASQNIYYHHRYATGGNVPYSLLHFLSELNQNQPKYMAMYSCEFKNNTLWDTLEHSL